MSPPTQPWSQRLRTLLLAQKAMPTFLLFEGAGGTGKTTLANDWAAAHGWTYEHNTHETHSADLYAKYQAQLGNCRHACVDRTFLSEQVYGTLLRGGSRLTPQHCCDLAALATARGGVFVHVTAAPNTIAKRLQERDGARPVTDELVALLAAYDRVFADLDDATVVRIRTDP